MCQQELKDSLITKEAERIEKEQLSKQLKEMEETMAQMKSGMIVRENVDSVLKEVQDHVQSETEMLRQRLAEEEKKEEERKVRHYPTPRCKVSSSNQPSRAPGACRLSNSAAG